MPKIRRIFLLELLLIIIAALYYSFFANKGLVFFDEGYFVHNAERIYSGQVPYKDFALQYGPTFFYLLAILYKFFIPSIIIGRIFTILICLSSIIVVFLILNKVKASSSTIILSFASLISFGYPLINIPNIIWFNVLLTLLLVFIFLKWLEKTKPFYALLLGILLALSISAKQNVGLAFVFLFSFLMLFLDKNSLKKRLMNLFILESTWLFLTLIWVYYFFLRDNWAGLLSFVQFSKTFAQDIGFSYPPITILLKPFGFFKLLPYYMPLLLLLAIIFLSTRKYKDLNILVLALAAIVGFFSSVFPQSDLLHAYPFLGIVLASLLVLNLGPKNKFFLSVLVFLSVLTGFYLTFFTKSYRYERLYLQIDAPLSLPKTQGILLKKDDQKAIEDVSVFISKNTAKSNYIFTYPAAPLLYFILDRQNPSKDAIYFLRSWHFYDDQVILGEIRSKKVKYIITHRGYKNDSPLSHFIQKQKPVLTIQEFKIFEIDNY